MASLLRYAVGHALGCVVRNALPQFRAPGDALLRTTRACNAAVRALSDPTRADAVAVLGEVTGAHALRSLHVRMKLHEVGRRLLAERPAVRTTSVELDRLRALPASTFGQAYCRFMDAHGFNPDERAAVRHVEDPELAYVMQRYREVHDFWHVVLGLPPTVLGELAVKWVEMLQTGLPVAALSALVGPLALPDGERAQLVRTLIPWAVRCSQRCEHMLNVHFEQHFEEDLVAFRRRLRVEPAPPLVASQLPPAFGL